MCYTARTNNPFARVVSFLWFLRRLGIGSPRSVARPLLVVVLCSLVPIELSVALQSIRTGTSCSTESTLRVVSAASAGESIEGEEERKGVRVHLELIGGTGAFSRHPAGLRCQKPELQALCSDLLLCAACGEPGGWASKVDSAGESGTGRMTRDPASCLSHALSLTRLLGSRTSTSRRGQTW